MVRTRLPQPHLVNSEAARNAREIERVFRLPTDRVTDLLGFDLNVWKNCRDGISQPRRELIALLRSIVEAPLFQLRARIVDQLEKTDRPLELLCDARTDRRISGVVRWDRAA
ncbi:hypothetical protein Pan44_53280 [Caulifigura coniformis]|uniref:Uncharacterized protein n=1 Tax=Caulifigura coniformis TaxID=2527983 RepID=A0A517SMA7_9PLAN|nr:hypothetical protein [Caulifigura coniformis]QDT57260.1 hypothetical protein Pan44_53280 [Caulifigura coniformis]